MNEKSIMLSSYVNSLKKQLSISEVIADQIYYLMDSLLIAWRSGKKIFICGNGGSAANASHMANDFIYGVGVKNGRGMKVEALTANEAVLTCLANDTGYENIFSEQLKVKADEEDVLIVLSGSGNSKNVINALKIANTLKMKSFAILGFAGGECKDLAQTSIHFEVNDMQIAEDLQLIVGHMCMQWLCEQKL